MPLLPFGCSIVERSLEQAYCRRMCTLAHMLLVKCSNGCILVSFVCQYMLRDGLGQNKIRQKGDVRIYSLQKANAQGK